MNFEGNKYDGFERLAKFITEHSRDDPDRLALQKGNWPEIDVATAVSTLVSRRKLTKKAPIWATTNGLVLPRTLSAEQCSGEAAARHKARAIREFLDRNSMKASYCDDASESLHCRATKSPGGSNAGVGKCRYRIADLTGGLGVDCLEFSKVAEAVLYNEMLPELAEAAAHNFMVLGVRNIAVCCFEASQITLCEGGSEVTDAARDVQAGNGMTAQVKPPMAASTCAGSLRKRLERFRPDVIYLDPARRDGCGKKVFLLEDCSPDILKIKDILLNIAPVLALKLSPMADIGMVLERLGNECRELHVIESGGECKELLVLMRRDAEKLEECLIKVYSLSTREGGDKGNESPVFEFRRDEESGCTGLRLAESEEIAPRALLFEPGKALMKAGCFKLIGERLEVPALGRDTHYYILKDNYMTADITSAPDEGECRNQEAQRNESRNAEKHDDREKNCAIKASVARAGKLFRILDVCEMSRKTIKEFGRRHPEAEVTARNVKMTSEELRKCLGCKSSDRYHTFALHTDKTDKNLLFFTERV